MAMNQLRSDLPALPPLLSDLRIDDRGYPVPFFVAYVKSQPEFRAMDGAKLRSCITRKLCWVCGKPLGDLPPVFVIGPMCAINRVSAEPPSHSACARFSVTACPFLIKPQMVRRQNDLPDQIQDPAGVSIRRNPGVTLLWFADRWEIWREPTGVLFHFTSAPKMVEWWTRGRKASRVEVLESIESGLPILEKSAQQDGPEVLAALDDYKARAMRLLPKE